MPHREDREGLEYELKNVFSKRMSDGEMFIFDLIDTAGDDNTCTEKQAVAIVSPHLKLPTFIIMPKAGADGAGSRVANKVLGWMMANFGSPVEFPQSPEFGRRHLVSSPDPDAARLFFDGNKLRRLAECRYIGVHAGGDVFTISRLDMVTKPVTTQSLAERVDQARGVFSNFIA
jgi:hypothetical protein